MTIFVNGLAVEVFPGMTVRHAILAAGLLEEVGLGRKVFDEWGNELGLDGAVAEGMRLSVG
jgi:hypothetical protein